MLRVLALSIKGRRGWIRPEVDESGHVDWGAFVAIDFDRLGRARYKANRLREHLKNAVVMLGIVIERVLGLAKYVVLKHPPPASSGDVG